MKAGKQEEETEAVEVADKLAQISGTVSFLPGEYESDNGDEGLNALSCSQIKVVVCGFEVCDWGDSLMLNSNSNVCRASDRIFHFSFPVPVIYLMLGQLGNKPLKYYSTL